MAVRPASLTLIEAAKHGDDAAFEIVLEPLLDQAYRLACAMLHNNHAAEDAVQEAAFKAGRKLSQLRGGSEMRPWFLGIVANECRQSGDRAGGRCCGARLRRLPPPRLTTRCSRDSSCARPCVQWIRRNAWCRFSIGISISHSTKSPP